MADLMKNRQIFAISVGPEALFINHNWGTRNLLVGTTDRPCEARDRDYVVRQLEIDVCCTRSKFGVERGRSARARSKKRLAFRIRLQRITQTRQNAHE